MELVKRGVKPNWLQIEGGTERCTGCGVGLRSAQRWT